LHLIKLKNIVAILRLYRNITPSLAKNLKKIKAKKSVIATTLAHSAKKSEKTFKKS